MHIVVKKKKKMLPVYLKLIYNRRLIVTYLKFKKKIFLDKVFEINIVCIILLMILLELKNISVYNH